MTTIEPYAWVPPVAQLNEHSTTPIKSVLGCGSWGCAFKLKNNQVLKVTTDTAEVIAVDLVRDLRDRGIALPGIVDYYTKPRAIAPFPWKDKSRQHIFVYQRELIVPLADAEEGRYDFGLPTRSRYGNDYESEGDAILQMNRFGTDLFQNRFNTTLKRTKAARAKEQKRLAKGYFEWFEMLRSDAPHANVNLQPIVESLAAIFDESLDDHVLTDIGPNNMGLSIAGYPKLFDFELVEL